MTAERGPGVRWLAARTGNEPDSPAAVLDALREIAGLAARAAVDPAARAEAEALREQIAAAPSPGEVFAGKVAAALRDAAERLRSRSAPG